jgi:hypothetical protein
MALSPGIYPVYLFYLNSGDIIVPDLFMNRSGTNQEIAIVG